MKHEWMVLSTVATLIFHKDGVNILSISFRYYTDEDFLKLEDLILASYAWGNPPWGLSHHEFSRGVHSAWRM